MLLLRKTYQIQLTRGGRKVKVKKIKRVHQVYGICLSVLLILAAGCLIWGSLTIYNSAPVEPYTMESIRAQYARFALPLWAAIIGILGGILLSVLLPIPQEKLKSTDTGVFKLKRKQRNIDLDSAAEGTRSQIFRERRLRTALSALCLVLCAASFVPTAVALCRRDAFTVEGATDEVLAISLLLLVGCVCSGVFLLLLSLLSERSIKREADATKIALASSPRLSTAPTAHSSLPFTLVRISILLLAVIFIILGATGGSLSDVLEKAIRICTECIGLG